MAYIFKNREFSKWIHQFFSEYDVQEQIKCQWDNNSPDIKLNTIENGGSCVPYDRFSDVSMQVVFPKNELIYSLEYRPNEWNPYPKTIPTYGGRYLVTVRSEVLDEEIVEPIQIDRYDSSCERWKINRSDRVLAFKALPEPFKPEK